MKLLERFSAYGVLTAIANTFFTSTSNPARIPTLPPIVSTSSYTVPPAAFVTAEPVSTPYLLTRPVKVPPLPTQQTLSPIDLLFSTNGERLGYMVASNSLDLPSITYALLKEVSAAHARLSTLRSGTQINPPEAAELQSKLTNLVTNLQLVASSSHESSPHAVAILTLLGLSRSFQVAGAKDALIALALDNPAHLLTMERIQRDGFAGFTLSQGQFELFAHSIPEEDVAFIMQAAQSLSADEQQHINAITQHQLSSLDLEEAGPSLLRRVAILQTLTKIYTKVPVFGMAGELSEREYARKVIENDTLGTITGTRISAIIGELGLIARTDSPNAAQAVALLTVLALRQDFGIREKKRDVVERGFDEAKAELASLIRENPEHLLTMAHTQRSSHGRSIIEERQLAEFTNALSLEDKHQIDQLSLTLSHENKALIDQLLLYKLSTEKTVFFLVEKPNEFAKLVKKGHISLSEKEEVNEEIFAALAEAKNKSSDLYAEYMNNLCRNLAQLAVRDADHAPWAISLLVTLAFSQHNSTAARHYLLGVLETSPGYTLLVDQATRVSPLASHVVDGNKLHLFLNMASRRVSRLVRDNEIIPNVVKKAILDTLRKHDSQIEEVRTEAPRASVRPLAFTTPRANKLLTLHPVVPGTQFEPTRLADVATLSQAGLSTPRLDRERVFVTPLSRRDTLSGFNHTPTIATQPEASELRTPTIPSLPMALSVPMKHTIPPAATHRSPQGKPPLFSTGGILRGLPVPRGARDNTASLS